jgi:hypothetical protein
MYSSRTSRIAAVLALLFIGGANLQAEDEFDLSSAFGALKETMGEVVNAVESSEDVDRALEEVAMDPLPAAVKNSNVPLSQINPVASAKATQQLASIDIQSPIEVDYAQQGKALTLTLWKGSQEHLKKLFTTIVKQLYSEKDANLIRFAVNSDPMPRINAIPVDFNDELRRAEIDKAHALAAQMDEEEKTKSKYGKAKTEPKPRPRPVEVPPRPGVEIRISAGLIAYAENVDEIAGQIAKVLAVLNPDPGVYGFKEDTRFTRNQKFLTMINEIIDESNDKVKEGVVSKKAQITAELAAMERLSVGGYNPWALYKYEERVLSWLADVIKKDKYHFFGKMLIDGSGYEIEDWSRPLRLRLQSAYMAYLQEQDRGVNMNRVNKNFSPKMKWIRLRMAAFTRPFFYDIRAQLVPLAVIPGTAIAYFFFPEIAHSALSAVAQTSGEVFNAVGSSAQVAMSNISDLVPAVNSQSATQVGDLTRKATDVSQTVLENAHLGTDVGNTLSSTAESVSAFFSNYQTELIASGSAITAGIAAKYRKVIGAVLGRSSEEIEDIEEPGRQSTEAVPRLEILQNDSKFRAQSGGDENAEKDAQALGAELIGGTTFNRPRRTEKIKNQIAGFFSELRTGSVSLFRESREGFWNKKKRVGQIIVTTGENITATKEAAVETWVVAVAKKKELSERSRAALYRYALAGRELSKALAQGTAVKSKNLKDGTIEKSVSAWEALASAVAATPDKLEQTRQGTVRVSVKFARGTKRVAKKSAIGTGRFIGKSAVGTARFTGRSAKGIFYTAPIAVFVGGVAAGVGLGNTVKAIGTSISDQHAQMKVNRQNRILWKEARAQRLEEGRKRLEAFFNDPDMKPAEITVVLEELEKVQRLDEDWAWEKWGIRSYKQKRKELDEHIIRAFSKWVSHAKKFGASNADLLKVIGIMNPFYEALTFDRKTETSFVNDGVALYEMATRSESKDIQWKIKYARDSRSDQFIYDMEVHYSSRLARGTGKGKEKVKTLVGSSDLLAGSLTRELFKKSEEEIFRWLTAPGTRPDEIIEFLNFLDKQKIKNHLFGNKYRIRQVLGDLVPLRRAKIFTTMSKSTLDRVVGSMATNLLEKSVSEVVEIWVRNSWSMRQLTQTINTAVNEYKIDANKFQLPLREAIMKRPDLIASYADMESFFTNDYYWSVTNSNSKSSDLELPLVELLNAKREQYKDSPAWKYDPMMSEKLHTMTKNRLLQIKQFPTDYEGLEKTWKLFTLRGVSTVTDDLLGTLLKMGTPEQIIALEAYAVTQGRVFDQSLRDEFAIRQIKRSPEYQSLMAVAKFPGTDRMQAIEAVIRLAQNLMTDLGIRYDTLLEEISVGIESTLEEATFIHEAKAKRLVDNLRVASDGTNDSRIKMLRGILPYIKTWKEKYQYYFLLYLRGSLDDVEKLTDTEKKERADAMRFIESQFPAFGPERIRKMYQGLPLHAAMQVVNLYLSDTILARKKVDEGYGKKLMEFLVSHGTDAQTEKYARLLLEGLMHGIVKVGNDPFQKDVLSALVAMKPGENASVGETLKLILEQFPGVGPKIGQFLVATGLLPDGINTVLRKTQDESMPPTRYNMYEDLRYIIGQNRPLGIHIKTLLGAGSLKYSLAGKELRTGQELALQIFRENVQNTAKIQIDVLNETVKYLIEKDITWSFLKVIVDGAMNAVAREKRYLREAVKTKLARLRLYTGYSDSDFTVGVPEQSFVNKRLLTSRFAPGGSFFGLTKEDQQRVGLKILEMESDVLFSNKKDVIWYDTDRHAGNFLVRVQNKQGKKHYKISPIDFGQLTYIRVDQRDKIAEMFALAGMLGKLGSNEWVVEKTAGLFDLKGEDLSRLRENLTLFFPGNTGQEPSVITSYFSLIAAINTAIDPPQKKWSLFKSKSKDAGRHRDLSKGKLDFAYTDFVRAIIQLNQYEERIKIPTEARTPRKILESRVKDILARNLKEVQLSSKQRNYIRFQNAKGAVASKVSGKEHVPLRYRLTREELDAFKLFPEEPRRFDEAKTLDPRIYEEWLQPPPQTVADPGRSGQKPATDKQPAIVDQVSSRLGQCGGLLNRIIGKFRSQSGP